MDSMSRVVLATAGMVGAVLLTAGCALYADKPKSYIEFESRCDGAVDVAMAGGYDPRRDGGPSDSSVFALDPGATVVQPGTLLPGTRIFYLVVYAGENERLLKIDVDQGETREVVIEGELCPAGDQVEQVD